MVEQIEYMNLSNLGPQQLYRDEEDDDEALSMCDLPLQDHHDREFSEPTRSSLELFEFFIGDSQMCPAEDIIFCGKLAPYKDHASSPPPLPSPDESNLTRSLNRRKIQRSPRLAVSPAPEIGRNSSVMYVDDSEKKVATTKPRWYLLLFGMVKLPEMELRDMKSRQFRRSPSVLFPDDANSRNCRSSWRLLRALSCKDHTSIAVTTSFRHIPQA